MQGVHQHGKGLPQNETEDSERPPVMTGQSKYHSVKAHTVIRGPDRSDFGLDSSVNANEARPQD